MLIPRYNPRMTPFSSYMIFSVGIIPMLQVQTSHFHIYNYFLWIIHAMSNSREKRWREDEPPVLLHSPKVSPNRTQHQFLKTIHRTPNPALLVSYLLGESNPSEYVEQCVYTLLTQTSWCAHSSWRVAFVFLWRREDRKTSGRPLRPLPRTTICKEPLTPSPQYSPNSFYRSNLQQEDKFS